jgi:hypothetical protein
MDVQKLQIYAKGFCNHAMEKKREIQFIGGILEDDLELNGFINKCYN